MRILLADDHILVRAGIRSLLEKIPGVEVVGEAGDGREAIALVAKHRPDLVLMDIAMSGLNGLEASARIARDFPQVRVMMLSMHHNEEYVIQALRTNAVGFLLKDAASTELALALKAFQKGETYLSPSISRHVIDGYIERMVAPAGTLDSLTSRQREILQMVAEGKTTREIAAELKLSVKTVEAHRTKLMRRLRTTDLAGMVRQAIRLGLVSVET
jgi:DNA-binding NarL/FixJ family response regulator